MRKPHKGAADSLFYYKWLDKALTDLQTAQILNTWDGDPQMVAFHCQQAIEKALKGYLLFKLGRHFDGHNLTFLCRQAVQCDKDFIEFLDESATLNNYYIETRYPTDIPFQISEQQVYTILRMAEDMFAMIRKELYESGMPHKIKCHENKVLR